MIYRTHIHNLDNALGGGFPSGHMAIVVGDRGFGKTRFMFELAKAIEVRGEHALYISPFAHNRNQLDFELDRPASRGKLSKHDGKPKVILVDDFRDVRLKAEKWTSVSRETGALVVLSCAQVRMCDMYAADFVLVIEKNDGVRTIKIKKNRYGECGQRIDFPDRRAETPAMLQKKIYAAMISGEKEVVDQVQKAGAMLAEAFGRHTHPVGVSVGVRANLIAGELFPVAGTETVSPVFYKPEPDENGNIPVHFLDDFDKKRIDSFEWLNAKRDDDKEPMIERHDPIRKESSQFRFDKLCEKVKAFREGRKDGINKLRDEWLKSYEKGLFELVRKNADTLDGNLTFVTYRRLTAFETCRVAEAFMRMKPDNAGVEKERWPEGDVIAAKTLGTTGSMNSASGQFDSVVVAGHHRVAASKYERMSKLASEMKEVAKKHGNAVVVASQANRAPNDERVFIHPTNWQDIQLGDSVIVWETGFVGMVEEVAHRRDVGGQGIESTCYVRGIDEPFDFSQIGLVARLPGVRGDAFCIRDACMTAITKGIVKELGNFRYEVCDDPTKAKVTARVMVFLNCLRRNDVIKNIETETLDGIWRESGRLTLIEVLRGIEDQLQGSRALIDSVNVALSMFEGITRGVDASKSIEYFNEKMHAALGVPKDLMGPPKKKKDEEKKMHDKDVGRVASEIMNGTHNCFEGIEVGDVLALRYVDPKTGKDTVLKEGQEGFAPLMVVGFGSKNPRKGRGEVPFMLMAKHACSAFPEYDNCRLGLVKKGISYRCPDVSLLGLFAGKHFDAQTDEHYIVKHEVRWNGFFYEDRRTVEGSDPISYYYWEPEILRKVVDNWKENGCAQIEKGIDDSLIQPPVKLPEKKQEPPREISASFYWDPNDLGHRDGKLW